MKPLILLDMYEEEDLDYDREINMDIRFYIRQQQDEDLDYLTFSERLGDRSYTGNWWVNSRAVKFLRMREVR